MKHSRSSFITVATIGLVLAIAACSGGDRSAPVEDEVTTTTIADGSRPTTSGSAPSTTAPKLTELRDDLDIAILVLEPTTETGSHPTLAWQPAEGGATYWLVLNDGEGRPYWAWTGSDTSVRVGGGDRSETNQTAALHEAMTWRVAAFDADGSLIALSDTASVAP